VFFCPKNHFNKEKGFPFYCIKVVIFQIDPIDQKDRIDRQNFRICKIKAATLKPPAREDILWFSKIICNCPGWFTSRLFFENRK